MKTANCIYVSINNKERYTYKHFYEFYSVTGIELGSDKNIIFTKEDKEKLTNLLEKANKELEYYKNRYSSYYNIEIEKYKYIIRTLKCTLKNILKGNNVEFFVE